MTQALSALDTKVDKLNSTEDVEATINRLLGVGGLHQWSCREESVG